ncbi:MAG: hypothetical protein PVJ17_03200 [Lysobacterales bacterium]|jgi:hypothetical protein
MNYLNFITRQETQNRVTMKYMFAMVALVRLPPLTRNSRIFND